MIIFMKEWRKNVAPLVGQNIHCNQVHEISCMFVLRSKKYPCNHISTEYWGTGTGYISNWRFFIVPNIISNLFSSIIPLDVTEFGVGGTESVCLFNLSFVV